MTWYRYEFFFNLFMHKEYFFSRDICVQETFGAILTTFSFLFRFVFLFFCAWCVP